MLDFQFGIGPSGIIEVDHNVEVSIWLNLTKFKVLQINLYNCDGCYLRGIFQALYILLVIHQDYNIIKEWFTEWNQPELKLIVKYSSIF